MIMGVMRYLCVCARVHITGPGCYTRIKSQYVQMSSQRNGLRLVRFETQSGEEHRVPRLRGAFELTGASETLLAITAPTTIKSCGSISPEGSKPCSMDASVNGTPMHVRLEPAHEQVT